MVKLVLASSSPRRQELLKLLTPQFTTRASAVESQGAQELPNFPIDPLPLPPEYQITAEVHPTLWAWRKAVDVARNLPKDNEPALVLAADTIVIGSGLLLGKPGSPEEAVWMLRELGGRKHYVTTGFVLLTSDRGVSTVLHTGAMVSTVWMRDYTDEELTGYVASGEPLDKAGAYAVQGLGGKLVGKVDGCYNNVVGLPICEARKELAAAAVPLLPYPENGYCSGCPALNANL